MWHDYVFLTLLATTQAALAVYFNRLHRWCRALDARQLDVEDRQGRQRAALLRLASLLVPPAAGDNTPDPPNAQETPNDPPREPTREHSACGGTVAG